MKRCKQLTLLIVACCASGRRRDDEWINVHADQEYVLNVQLSRRNRMKVRVFVCCCSSFFLLYSELLFNILYLLSVVEMFTLRFGFRM